MDRSRSSARIAALCCALASATLSPGRASAELMLRVSGEVDAVQTIQSGQALAFSFTLPRAVANLSVLVGPNVACVGCAATAWLSRDIDADFNPSDLVAASDLTAWNPRVFSGLTLAAGTYFAVVRADRGSIVWPASQGATRVGAATSEGDWRTDAAGTVGPASDFAPLVGDDGQLHYVLSNEICGDGSVDFDDVCDDGNLLASDGCSGACTSEPGYTCSFSALGARSRCSTVCGDGFRVASEQCDDGNASSGDGCRADCSSERCGDGQRDPQEQCDDGNTNSGDGCDASCRAVVCGDSRVVAPEQCDDGNLTSGDGCNASCRREVCGNGVLDVGEQCDDGNTSSGDGCRASCLREACGDAQVDLGEQCDDANLVNGDGCRDNCTTERCGDGVVDVREQCDDGNERAGDGCRADCTFERCGDGARDPQEQCDDGNLLSGDGCDVDCVRPRCGDGRLDAGEQCDDRNESSSDGCSASCTREVCGNGIKDPGEQCDDANLRDRDGCSGRCQTEIVGGEGCAASYWLRDRHYRAWKGYAPGASYAAVFGIKTPLKLTLLNALGQANQGERGLARQAVAALLNASNTSVKYAWTPAQLIAKVRAAYAANKLESLRLELVTENERRPCALRADGGCYRDPK